MAPDCVQYECFVEGCEKICATASKRRLHLIDKHMYPKVCLGMLDIYKHSLLIAFQNYDFFIVNSGIDRRSSMLRTEHRRKTSTALNHDARQHTEGSTSQYNGNEEVINNRGSELPKAKDTMLDDNGGSNAASNEVDLLASSLSALRFVPPSIQFGRGGKRGGFNQS